jgi:hypothetical protein
MKDYRTAINMEAVAYVRKVAPSNKTPMKACKLRYLVRLVKYWKRANSIKG